MEYTGTAKIPRGYLATDGICPITRETRPFLISQEFMVEIQRNGPEWKFYDALIIPEVSQSPTAIFEGLERDGLDDSYCYCGIPSKRYVKSKNIGTTIEIPFPPNRVFVVFVTCNEKGFVVFDWEKRDEDSGRPGWPKNWENDFKELKWQAH